MDDQHYYLRLAAAFVRGRLPSLAPDLDPEEYVAAGLEAGLRLHKFKRSAELPRVRRVMGMLHALAPASLLDVGSGRGTFLWPLLDAFPDLDVVAIDANPTRVRDIEAVREGGIATVTGRLMDATRLELESDSADGVTALEVLEHLHEPAHAVSELVRVARRFVIASVPSREDDNPEHLHLLEEAWLEEAFSLAGARKVTFEYVPNHRLVLATL